jgi:hypothetical protein
MLDGHEGEAAVRRCFTEEPLQRVHATGRRADADHRERQVGALFELDGSSG